MARITLHIDAESSTDLADCISSLMYLSAYKSEAEDPQDVVRPAARRVDQDAASSASGAGTATEAGSAGTGSTTGVRRGRPPKNKPEETPMTAAIAAEAGAKPDDPFMDQIKRAADEVAQEDGETVSLAMIKSLGTEYAEKHSVNALRELLIKSAGVSNMSAIPEEKYGAVFAALKAE